MLNEQELIVEELKTNSVNFKVGNLYRIKSNKCRFYLDEDINRDLKQDTIILYVGYKTLESPGRIDKIKCFLYNSELLMDCSGSLSRPYEYFEEVDIANEI